MSGGSAIASSACSAIVGLIVYRACLLAVPKSPDRGLWIVRVDKGGPSVA